MSSVILPLHHYTRMTQYDVSYTHQAQGVTRMDLRRSLGVTRIIVGDFKLKYHVSGKLMLVSTSMY